MSDDLISRQAAINVADGADYTGLSVEDVKKVTDEVVKGLKKLPSAQQWIPVSERLPEASGRYLVTRGLNACGAMWNRVYLINYSDLMGLKSERIWWNGNVGKSDFERIDDVTAWMPLPKPYKEADNGRDPGRL